MIVIYEKIMDKKLIEKALEYHSDGKAGKIEVQPSKSADSPEKLSLAYTPGVAAPAIEIGKERWKAYKYTNKGNLVAVISNGSAVLGLRSWQHRRFGIKTRNGGKSDVVQTVCRY